MQTVSVRTYLQPLRRLGLDLWRAEVRDVAGRVLFRSERWSESQARAEATRWIMKHAAH